MHRTQRERCWLLRAVFRRGTVADQARLCEWKLLCSLLAHYVTLLGEVGPQLVFLLARVLEADASLSYLPLELQWKAPQNVNRSEYNVSTLTIYLLAAIVFWIQTIFICLLRVTHTSRWMLTLLFRIAESNFPMCPRDLSSASCHAVVKVPLLRWRNLTLCD